MKTADLFAECSFCDGDGDPSLTGNDRSTLSWRVHCRRCDAWGPPAATKEEAVTRWLRSAALPDELEKARIEVRRLKGYQRDGAPARRRAGWAEED